MIINVTHDSDFVWGNVDVSLRLFPKALNFSFSPIEKVCYVGRELSLVHRKDKSFGCQVVKCFEKDLVYRGLAPEGDWLNYAVKVTVKRLDQRSLKYM